MAPQKLRNWFDFTENEGVLPFSKLFALVEGALNEIIITHVRYRYVSDVERKSWKLFYSTTSFSHDMDSILVAIGQANNQKTFHLILVTSYVIMNYVKKQYPPILDNSLFNNN